MVVEIKKIHLFRHVAVNDHRNVSYDDFKSFGSGFRNNAFERKLAEALINQGIKVFSTTGVENMRGRGGGALQNFKGGGGWMA